jgi:hypothetical protein
VLVHFESISLLPEPGSQLVVDWLLTVEMTVSVCYYLQLVRCRLVVVAGSIAVAGSGDVVTDHEHSINN